MANTLVCDPRLKDWTAVMRLPFTTVAVAPFVMGAYLAWSHGSMTSMAAPVMGAVAVFLICIGCYTLGEVFDNEEDLETIKHGRSKFAGGTLLVAQGRLGKRPVLTLSTVSFIIAMVLGVCIFLIQKNPVLIGLGVFGMFSAAFYSMPPVRLVKRGYGELFIAVCYGWLAVASGYACASGKLPGNGFILSLPSALTVFNIILINEFPDYEADRAALKKNLLNRVGRSVGGVIYSVAAIAACGFIMFIWASNHGGATVYLAAALPVVLLGVWLAIKVGILKRWEDKKRLETICALSIVLNLASTIVVGVLAG